MNFIHATSSPEFIREEFGNRRFCVIGDTELNTTATATPAPNALQILLDDDALAMSCQTLAQYRSILAKRLHEIYPSAPAAAIAGQHTPGRITAPITPNGRAFGLIPEGKGWADDLINWSTREFKNPADAERLADGWNALVAASTGSNLAWSSSLNKPLDAPQKFTHRNIITTEEHMDTNVLPPATANTPFAGGLYAGKIMIAGTAYALVVAPKGKGEIQLPWNSSNKRVTNAESFNDGAANTAAMLEAGSDLAKWAAGLTIDGYSDWYIPSLDELEVIYRNLKPTVEENSQYARSGINVSAIPPTMPYSRTEPAQTQAEAFKAGGEQAFEEEWYWTSTQHAVFSDYAWGQHFLGGSQFNSFKSASGRARAVRRLPI